MSIYDFLQDGESQEVQPSETVPQVDEAQEVKAPSSALDTSIPTEDTDSTLFSVGDTVKIVNIYDKTHEDYEYMETVKGSHRVITSEVYITKGNKRHYNTVSHGESWLPSNEVPFYIEELQKI